MKKIIIVLAIVVVVGLGLYLFWPSVSESPTLPSEQSKPEAQQPAVSDQEEQKPATSEETKPVETIGSSVGDRDIVAYHYGTGEKEVLFVGGIHGGYSWNTILVARELMSYLDKNPRAIPEGLQVTVIPVLNPDGLYKTVGTVGEFSQKDIPSGEEATVSGRFNAHNVDLNRNFDCDWQATGTWRDKAVSGGSRVFSEPETQAMRTYIEQRAPAAVVVWYSAAGGVFASNCHNGILPETRTLMNLYAQASGYKAYDSFDFYEVTGDMVNWLAGEKIPAISVLLTNHSDTEWEKNRAGIDALLKHYAQ